MRERKRFLALGSALLAALLFVPPATADQSPEGCLGSNPTVRFATETIGQTEGLLRQGDQVVLGARIANPGASACDISDVTVRVRLPKPDGSPGDYRTLTSNLFLGPGVSVEGFTEVDPYVVDLDEDVFEAPLEIEWQALVHDGNSDQRVSGSGTGLKIRITRPRAQLTVQADPLLGPSPLAVTRTYLLTNASPSPPAGLPAPSLVPPGLDGSRDALGDSGCEPVTYLSGDAPSEGSPALGPGETWKFTCSRTYDLPGTYTSQPALAGTSSADGRPWPQVTAPVESSSVRVLGADLALDKSHKGDFLAAGTGEYRLKVTNSGNLSTFGTVSVEDQLPSSLTAKAISGEGWSCDLVAVRCSRSDPLASGASYPDVVLTVAVASKPPASVINNALVSGGGESAGALANNSDSDLTRLRTPIQPDPPGQALFRVKKVKSLGDGTVSVKVAVPAAGRLVADDARKPDLVQRSSRKASRARTINLTLKANRALRRQIRRSGKSGKVRVRFSFVARGNPVNVGAISLVRPIRFDLRPSPADSGQAA